MTKNVKRLIKTFLLFKFVDSTMNFDLNFVFQCVLKKFFYHSNTCHKLWISGTRVLSLCWTIQVIVLIETSSDRISRSFFESFKKGRLVFQIELRILALQNRCTVLLKLVKVPFGFRMRVLIVFRYSYLLLFQFIYPF